MLSELVSASVKWTVARTDWDGGRGKSASHSRQLSSCNREAGGAPPPAPVLRAVTVLAVTIVRGSGVLEVHVCRLRLETLRTHHSSYPSWQAREVDTLTCRFPAEVPEALR